MSNISVSKSELKTIRIVRDAVIGAIEQHCETGEAWIMHNLDGMAFEGQLLGDAEDGSDDVILGADLVDGATYLIVELVGIDAAAGVHNLAKVEVE